MYPAAMSSAAAGPILAVLKGITDADLDLPTPCSEFDVRGLAQHLLQWGPALEAAATKASAELATPAADADLREALTSQIERIATAWTDPTAWDGSTSLGSPDQMPAELIGGMVLTEMVVHGWDLARATGRSAAWSDEVLAFVHGEVKKTAAWGRELGIYAQPIPVDDTAPLLARTLGLTGRDPEWTPQPTHVH